MEPGAQLLVCPFCGTAAPFNVDAATGAIEELDLAKALREIPDEERGWQTEKRTVQCQSCKAVSVFDPERVGQNCDFCGSPKLVDYQEIKAPIRPQSLLPFTVTETGGPRADPEVVREQVAGAERAQDARARRSRPRRLHSLLDVRRPRRLPLAGRCRALLLRDGNLSAERPHADAPGPQVRWVPASGEVRHFFDDEPVPGTHGVVARRCCAGRAVPHQRAEAVRQGVCLRLRRRALPDRARSTRRSVREESMTERCGSCARRRFPATPTAT